MYQQQDNISSKIGNSLSSGFAFPLLFAHFIPLLHASLQSGLGCGGYVLRNAGDKGDGAAFCRPVYGTAARKRSDLADRITRLENKFLSLSYSHALQLLSRHLFLFSLAYHFVDKLFHFIREELTSKCHMPWKAMT